MKKNNSIFWILGLGGLVYAAYELFIKNSASTKDKYSEVPDTNLKTGEKYSDYQIRVFYLQTLLGVGTDYIVGKNTTAALKELYLGNLTYGEISPDNIEKYIADIENKNTPYNRKMKANAYADANAKSEKKVLAIIDAYSSDKSLVLNLNTLNSVGGQFQVYRVVFNSATKDWERTGTININAGKKTRDGGVPYSYSPKWNALIVRLNLGGVYNYVAINPDFVQVIR